MPYYTQDQAYPFSKLCLVKMDLLPSSCEKVGWQLTRCVQLVCIAVLHVFLLSNHLDF